MFFIIVLSCLLNLGVSNDIFNDDDNDDFALDYTIHNTINIYNNTYCNTTFIDKSLVYGCSCEHSNTCLKNYFNSKQFNTIGIQRLCDTNFTNNTNYNRCIVCNNNTSVNFGIKIDDKLCNNKIDGFLVFGFFLIIMILALGIGLIYAYHKDRRIKRNYMVLRH